MGNTNNRTFSYNRGVRYKGNTYPSSDALLVDNNGQQRQGLIFADNDSNYYTLLNGAPMPVTPVHTLDEVTVTAPKKHKRLSDAFGDYLTQSNDITMVNNLPHGEYNTHLKDNAINGAKSHAIWEQEHPNLAAWSNAAASVPFAVAAAPFVLGAGEAVAGTALGQGITNGLGIVANAASNNTWLPWIDAGVTSIFGAKGLQDMANGKFTPETAMEVMPLMQLGKPMYEAGKGAYDVGKELYDANKFKSELDWSPESWFGKYRPKEYDASDIAALKSHIPEFHRIEQQAKAKGTWLKMSDGSTWEGDPRGWVMLQSKNVRNKYRDEVLHHGEDTYFDDMSFYTDENGNNMTGEMLGDRVVWTSTNPRIAPTYGEDVYPFVIPKNTDIKTVADAQGRYFNEVVAGTKIDTDALVYPNLTEDNVIRINNVIDPGPNINLAKVKDALPNETMEDYMRRKYIGDDLVLGQNISRKSLYGNNGNFDLDNFNIFKSLIPVGIGLSGSTMLNKSDN